MTTLFRELVWTPERVQTFWEYESQFPHRYFTYRNGERFLRTVRHYIEPDAVILDYACGAGFLMGILLAAGYKVAGLEISATSLAEVTKKFAGQPNFLGGFTTEQAVVLGRQFDVIFVVELVEHLAPDMLDSIFGNLRRLLKPGGRIIITTPNEENLMDLSLACPECKLVFHRWQHVRSWSRETLSTYVERQGFKVVDAFPADLSLKPRSWKWLRYKLGLKRREPKNLIVIAALP